MDQIVKFVLYEPVFPRIDLYLLLFMKKLLKIVSNVSIIVFGILLVGDYILDYKQISLPFDMSWIKLEGIAALIYFIANHKYSLILIKEKDEEIARLTEAAKEV